MAKVEGKSDEALALRCRGRGGGALNAVTKGRVGTIKLRANGLAMRRVPKVAERGDDALGPKVAGAGAEGR